MHNIATTNQGLHSRHHHRPTTVLKTPTTDEWLRKGLRPALHMLQVVSPSGAVRVSLTVVGSNNEKLENSELNYTFTWHTHTNSFAVTSREQQHPEMVAVLQDADEVSVWLAKRVKVVMMAQLETNDVHFKGEREILTIYYSPRLVHHQPSSSSSSRHSRLLLLGH